jgi:hypothetical protein
MQKLPTPKITILKQLLKKEIIFDNWSNQLKQTGRR